MEVQGKYQCFVVLWMNFQRTGQFWKFQKNQIQSIGQFLGISKNNQNPRTGQFQVFKPLKELVIFMKELVKEPVIYLYHQSDNLQGIDAASKNCPTTGKSQCWQVQVI